MNDVPRFEDESNIPLNQDGAPIYDRGGMRIDFTGVLDMLDRCSACRSMGGITTVEGEYLESKRMICDPELEQSARHLAQFAFVMGGIPDMEIPENVFELNNDASEATYRIASRKLQENGCNLTDEQVKAAIDKLKQSM